MIPLPTKANIIEEKKDLIKIEIEGLYPGYGTTIGNSLRRILISSLPGTAVTQVKIKGVQHQFSTIPNVIEDVVSIIMNIKQMRFNLHSEEAQKATLSVKGEKEVKASDFKFPTQIELVNKDCHIATLTSKNAQIEMEITVDRGIGYQMTEERKEEKKPEAGVISIDSIFSPVKRVNYRVENMRVKERTDFEKLHMEIYLDGTIDPKESINKALQILGDHISSIGKLLLGEEKKNANDLNLSARTQAILDKNELNTIKKLIKKTEKDLISLEGMGEKGVEEIKNSLKEIDLELKNEKA